MILRAVALAALLYATTPALALQDRPANPDPFPTVSSKKGLQVQMVDDALALMGVETQKVREVVITHLHYDHVGNFDLFPRATFHLQDLEMQYATGRCMCHEPMRHAFDVEDVVGMVRNVYTGRVRFHAGDAQIAPGLCFSC